MKTFLRQESRLCSPILENKCGINQIYAYNLCFCRNANSAALFVWKISASYLIWLSVIFLPYFFYFANLHEFHEYNDSNYLELALISSALITSNFSLISLILFELFELIRDIMSSHADN